MSIQGKAVVFSDKERVEWKEISLPDPGPDDVVVRVKRSWISNGTESSFLRAERKDGETPHSPSDPWPFPLVPGYQKTGIVESVGTNVEGVRVGDEVFATVSWVGEGFYQKMGGHVSPAITPAHQIWPLPKGLSGEAASGLVLLQVGYNCGTTAPVKDEDSALVIGDGLVGHWAAQTLLDRGARVILAGKHDDRLKMFEDGERRTILNVSRENLVDGVRRMAPTGLAVAVDTVGSLSSIEACFPLMRHHGHLVSAGFHKSGGKIDIQELRKRELSLHAPSGWQKDRMDAALDLLARGRLQTVSLITHRFQARRAPEAYRLILKRMEPVLGVVLEWEA